MLEARLIKLTRLEDDKEIEIDPNEIVLMTEITMKQPAPGQEDKIEKAQQRNPFLSRDPALMTVKPDAQEEENIEYVTKEGVMLGFKGCIANGVMVKETREEIKSKENKGK